MIAGLCAASAALAQDAREPIRLSYTADAGCPSASDFEAAVLERTRRARPAGKGEIAREYRIVVTALENKSVARLEFAATGGGTVTREVSAQNCAEAAKAIALVTALAFDAAAAGAGEGAEGSETARKPGGQRAPSEPAAPSSGPGAPPAKPKTPGPERNQRRREAPAAREAVPPVKPSSKSPGTAYFDLGARATLTSPKAPVVLPGAELFAAVSDPGAMWLLQMGVAGERGFRLESGPGEARFSFLGGRLQGCFFGIALDPAIVLMPCALFEAGAVIAEGFIQDSETTHVDPWYALGPSARLSWALAWSTAVVEAGPVFPLRPDDRVVFGDIEAPLAEIHDVPPVGAFVSIGLSFGLR